MSYLFEEKKFKISRKKSINHDLGKLAYTQNLDIRNY